MKVYNKWNRYDLVMQKDSSIPSVTTRIFFICLSSSPKLMCSQKKAYKFNEKIPFFQYFILVIEFSWKELSVSSLLLWYHGCKVKFVTQPWHQFMPANLWHISFIF